MPSSAIRPCPRCRRVPHNRPLNEGAVGLSPTEGCPAVQRSFPHDFIPAMPRGRVVRRSQVLVLSIDHGSSVHRNRARVPCPPLPDRHSRLPDQCAFQHQSSVTPFLVMHHARHQNAAYHPPFLVLDRNLPRGHAAVQIRASYIAVGQAARALVDKLLAAYRQNHPS